MVETLNSLLQKHLRLNSIKFRCLRILRNEVLPLEHLPLHLLIDNAVKLFFRRHISGTTSSLISSCYLTSFPYSIMNTSSSSSSFFFFFLQNLLTTICLSVSLLNMILLMALLFTISPIMISDFMSNIVTDLCLQVGLEGKVCGADLAKFMNQSK